MLVAPKKAFEPTVVWQPQSGPQTALITCPIFEVFFGGARGGGKTESSIGDWLEHSATYGEHAIGIFVRRKLKQLEEVIARTQQIFRKIGAVYNVQQKTWTMPGGGRLKFVYLEKDTDAEEYQGHSYTRVYVEELTNFPNPGPVNKLKATLRSGAGVPCGMRMTGNPGGPGHQWVKVRYIDPHPQGYVPIKEIAEFELDGEMVKVELERVFIPSKIRDNRLLLKNDPTYILRLKQSGSEALVKAWLDGDWSIIDGCFFDEWDENKHVLPAEKWMARIPRGSTCFRAMDWGSAKPFSIGWYVKSDGTWGLPRGAIVKIDEWYGKSGVNKGLKLSAAAVARGVKARDDVLRKEYGLWCKNGAADPAIFIQNGGPSIAEMMAGEGISWAPADNKRVPGWQVLRNMLRGPLLSAPMDAEVRWGAPELYFLDTCVDSIRTLPALQHDEADSEDLDTEAEDHAADEIRYACMYRSQITDTVSSSSRLQTPPGTITLGSVVQGLLKLAREKVDL